MSNKTRYAFEETFESAVNEHKSNIAKDMAEFGEHKRIKKLHDDVDSEAHNYEWYFTKGAQSRQVEIDNLIIANAEMKSRLNDAYTNGQSAMYAVKQKEIEKLKAEISIGKEDVSIMTMIHGTCEVNANNKMRCAFEEADNTHPDHTFKFDEATNLYVFIDFEMMCTVEDINDRWLLWQKAWRASTSKPNTKCGNLLCNEPSTELLCPKCKASIRKKEDVSIVAMIHGTCDCGTAWQPILSDKQGFNKLHCFACGNNRYESKEFFGDCEQGE